MKINTSYALKDTRITANMSYPEPTERNRQDIAKHISWIMQQKDPKVSVE